MDAATDPQLQDAAGDGASDARMDRLNSMGLSLAKKRSDFIAGREASGIEQQWLEDEEFFQGIDDLNRNEHGNAWRTKPPGQYQVQATNTTRSTVFVNITESYCKAAAARISDMLLPSDDRNFEILPTPLPDLVTLSKGETPSTMRSTPPSQIKEAAAAASKMIDEAKAKAEKAQTRIEDWLVQCQYHAEVRKVIEDSARIGSGVLKGPIPMKSRKVALENGAIVIKQEIKPGSKCISPWDFYPDPACGESIHNGSGTWERDRLTPRQLEDLKGTPGYLDFQIDECLTEGPQKAVATTKKDADALVQPAVDDPRFEIWYFHGFIEKDDIEAAGCSCEGEKNPRIPAMITMVNNRVIRASLNPLDSGDFPYDVMPWQRKIGMPWGNGVGRQGRTPQRIVNAGVRNMMDNGGLSAGAQWVIKQGAITPMDGQYSLTPRKGWQLGPDGDMDDVRKAMAFFEIPSRQEELMAIVQFGLKMMEDTTGLPMLLQGQLGKAPDTVGGMTMLNNNASAVLRRLARTFDDCVTEPHIRRYYTWLLQYGEDDEKGDFSIDARGSSALVERDLQAQQLPNLWAMAQNPASKLDPAKVALEIVKSMKFDSKNVTFDDEKWEQIVASLSQKPADPRVEVETIRQQGETARTDMKLKAEAHSDDKDHQVNLLIEHMRKEGNKEITLEKLKAALAETGMELSTTKELAVADRISETNRMQSKEVAKPPIEPAGRAENGKAYQQ